MGEDTDFVVVATIAAAGLIVAIIAIHHWVSGWRHRRAWRRLERTQRQQHQKG